MYRHTVCVSCAHAAFWAYALGSSTLLENGISKDFLSTLIRCVWELCSLIKPLIIARLAHFIRVKLIKTFLQAGKVGGRTAEGAWELFCVS